MKQLQPYPTKFWDQPCVCHSAVLDEVFGDGAEWVFVQYLDDRPDYYVARCNTGTHVLMERQSEDWYDLLADIEAAIEEEAGKETTEAQEDEIDRIGYAEDTRDWPIPPGRLSSGTTWGKYTPDAEDLALAKAPSDCVSDRSDRFPP